MRYNKYITNGSSSPTTIHVQSFPTTFSALTSLMQAPFSYPPPGYYYVPQASAGAPYAPDPIYPHTPAPIQVPINGAASPYVLSSSLLQGTPKKKEKDVKAHDRPAEIPRRCSPYSNPWAAFRPSTPEERKRASGPYDTTHWSRFPTEAPDWVRNYASGAKATGREKAPKDVVIPLVSATCQLPNRIPRKLTKELRRSGNPPCTHQAFSMSLLSVQRQKYG